MHRSIRLRLNYCVENWRHTHDKRERDAGVWIDRNHPIYSLLASSTTLNLTLLVVRRRTNKYVCEWNREEDFESSSSIRLLPAHPMFIHTWLIRQEKAGKRIDARCFLDDATACMKQIGKNNLVFSSSIIKPMCEMHPEWKRRSRFSSRYGEREDQTKWKTKVIAFVHWFLFLHGGK